MERDIRGEETPEKNSAEARAQQREWNAFRAVRASVSFLGIGLLGWILVSAVGPDTDVETRLAIPAQATLEQLDLSLRATINWPRWFRGGATAQRVGAEGRAFPMRDQVIERGAQLRILLNPTASPKEQIVLSAVVSEYEPRRRLVVQLRGDSHERLTRAFSSLEWIIEIGPPSMSGAAAEVAGTVRATTASASSRVLARVFGALYLRQAFYPDLVKLAELTQPSPPNPFSGTQQ